MSTSPAITGTWPPKGKVSEYGYVIPTRADRAAGECYIAYAEATGRWGLARNHRRCRFARIGNSIAAIYARNTARNAGE